MILKEYNENLKFIKEQSAFEYDRPLLEQHKLKNGKYIMRGMFMQAEIINQNGRFYPRNILQRETQNAQKWIKERRFYGTLDHEDSNVVNLREVSHIITEMWMSDDNNVYGSVEVLETPNGKILQTLIDNNIKIGISSRGIGETEHTGEYELVKEYQIISLDAVADPSAPSCFLFKESKNLSRENYNEIKKLFTKDDKIDKILNEILF